MARTPTSEAPQTKYSNPGAVAPPQQMFKDIYKDSSITPPWDTGKPQKRVVEAEQEGLFQGEVLDAGTGPGDNAVFLASKGYKVTALDFSPDAIKQAESRWAAAKPSAAAGGEATFLVADALDLSSALGDKKFDAVLDSALFHVFSDEHRKSYIQSLNPQVKKGGRLLLLTFSEKNPDPWRGPRRVTETELQQEFNASTGWVIESISETTLEDNIHEGGGGAAWCMVATRQ